jgi:hypothetical protein
MKAPKAALMTAVAIVAIVACLVRVSRAGANDPGASASHSRGRIVVLMVWDGLRPDLVDAVNTPNLFAVEQSGVSFSRHHSIYPTLTMVNAAGLATGAAPGGSGIYGDAMYLRPVLDMARAAAIPQIGVLLGDPLNLENSRYLAELNDPRAFDRRLLGLRTTVKEVAAAGGYVAVIGKAGPTLLFDDDFAIKEEAGGARNYMFVADDMATPQALAAEIGQEPPMKRGDYGSIIARDTWFAKLTTDRALPAARAVAESGKPAMIVLWQHNPDLTQHVAGLGTQPALEALHACDANLAALRAAIVALGIADRTDLIVVSDHGFATIKAIVPLARLLVAAGLKKSVKSAEVVVADGGGSESIYVSRSDFPTVVARRERLRRIVEYAAAQEWVGPIFAREIGAKHARHAHKDRGTHGYDGSIAGTFDESAFGLDDNARAPDLIISFRELSDVDNRDLTGPEHPGVAIGPDGPEAQANHSSALVRPVPGVVYADANSFTTGMGMHGAAGVRELHNFCAAIGPDFRRGFIDTAPTGNADIAPTAAAILGQAPVEGVTGRMLREALAGRGHAIAHPHGEPVMARTALQLKNSRVTTTLKLTRYGGREYLDDSMVTVTPVR